MTIGKLRPVTNIQLNVKLQISRAGHEDRGDSHTFIVEAAVIGVGCKNSIAILTLWADNIKTGPIFSDKWFALSKNKKAAHN